MLNDADEFYDVNDKRDNYTEPKSLDVIMIQPDEDFKNEEYIPEPSSSYKELFPFLSKDVIDSVRDTATSVNSKIIS